MPKLDLDTIPQTNATGYPPPFDAPVAGRWYRRLAPPGGLEHFGASHVVLKPGAWSSQRHWHADEDELVVMIAGEAVLVEDGGETILRAGDVASFAAGVGDGHHLQNRSDSDCVFVAISAGPDVIGGEYPDIDMVFGPDGYARRMVRRTTPPGCHSRYAVAGCSNCSITHSSSCADAIQSCINGWLSTASM